MQDRGPELEISHPAYLLSRSQSAALSSLEKLHVHQVVRMGFPHLTSVPMSGAVKVLLYSEQVERAAQIQAVMALDQRIQRQMGISWFFEGLKGSGELEQAVCHYLKGEWERADSFRIRLISFTGRRKSPLGSK